MLNHCLHSPSCIIIKSKGRPHNPYYISTVFLFIFEQAHEPIIIPRIRGFPASSLTKDKLILQRLCLVYKSMTVHIDPFFTFFRPPQNHLIALFDISFHYLQMTVITENHTGIHAAFLCKNPSSVNFEIFRIHGCAVIIFRCNSILLCNGDFYIWRIHKLRLCKIRVMVFRHFK